MINDYESALKIKTQEKKQQTDRQSLSIGINMLMHMPA